MKPLIFLAPMEGVFDHTTRKLLAEIGGYNRMATEFVRVVDKLLPAHVFHRYSPELKSGGRIAGVPVFIQLLGSDPFCLAENAALAVELGAPGIDLNFGCPAKTVNRHDGGATLLKNPERVFAAIGAVVKSVAHRVPVTAKVRLGFADKSLHLEIAAAVADAGASLLTVHARTRAELYSPPAHWEYVARMKLARPNLTVLANGEIWTAADYEKCISEAGVRDVALARGAFADPFLARRIRGEILPNTWLVFQRQIFPEFLAQTEKERGAQFALARGKQWLKAVAGREPKASEYFARAKRSLNLAEFKQAVGLGESFEKAV